MTAIQIPFNTSLPDQQLSVDLGDTTFIFRIKWNTTAQLWFLSMFDDESRAIFEGLAFVNGLNFFEAITDARIPVGVLFPFNYDDSSSDCGRLDLNESVFLIYDDLES